MGKQRKNKSVKTNGINNDSSPQQHNATTSINNDLSPQQIEITI